jgi:3-oxoacyl-[acyl-carrier protein] reductase
MDLGLKGKNAAITGSSQGIGYAIATALAKEGCNVALSARGAERLGTAVTDMERHGVKAVGIVADLATEQGCKDFVEQAAAQLGGLDILVNNVGGKPSWERRSSMQEKWSSPWAAKAAARRAGRSSRRSIRRSAGRMCFIPRTTSISGR